ncbi:DKNYY domain-containing protein [Pedobacter xixiisoli]|nr:DKNYY domain-containing protein [Pedobacter xixiisoli]
MGRKALGHHFFVIDHQMILHFDSEVYRKFYSVIDFETFEIIQSNGSTFHYFKDKNHVYIDSYMNSFDILPGANPADFQILDFEKGMASSGNADYLFEQRLPHRFSAYEALSGLYQKVGNKIYCFYHHELAEADVETFEVLYPSEVQNVAKDKNHVYFRDQLVPDADAESFHFLAECFTADYYRERDHTYYAKDKNVAYYVDTISKAFKVIKTKNLANFHFKVIGELGYAFDGQYQYLFGKRKKIEAKS